MTRKGFQTGRDGERMNQGRGNSLWKTVHQGDPQEEWRAESRVGVRQAGDGSGQG